MYADMEQYRNIFSPPNVTTYCVVGYNISTMATLHWAANQTFNDQFQVLLHCYSLLTNFQFNVDNTTCYQATTGDGDGVVLAESLDCSQWMSQQDKPVVTYRFNGLIHGAPPTNQQVIELFLKSLGLDYIA